MHINQPCFATQIQNVGIMEDAFDKIEQHIRRKRIVLRVWWISPILIVIWVLVALRIDELGDDPSADVGYTPSITLYMLGALIVALNLFVVSWLGWRRNCPFCDNRIEGAAYPVDGVR